ncbi:MAG: ATP-dependent RNA helicase HrpA [Canibacter sp.]
MSKPTQLAHVKLEFPPELPVSGMVDEITDALESHQVVIIAGETGSGKTTQLPKIALQLGRTRIAHTQPRRIAARAVAERIAEETETTLGDTIGYQVRFAEKVSENTMVRIMTDGILLNAIHHDRLLTAYDTIIIDEAHERSLNIDFLLGYLKTILPRRPDLKVIITSATIDPQSFSRHFNDAPIVEVSGRSYPVEIRYRPLISEREITQPGQPTQTHRIERDLFDAISDAVLELGREDPGDILVFLSGEAEIRDANEALSGRLASVSGRLSRSEVLPLFGRLSAADQHRIFRRPSPGTTRIILATNVAETSLTVPGIKYVIDAGTARISRYSTRSKVQRLPIEAISQASAKQRSGRSGRTSAGIAIRLYSEDDYLARPEYTDPEILRTGLASVILQMMSLGLSNTKQFPFLTPPDQRGVRDGNTLLEELGAVRNNKITRLGRSLVRLPIEPRYGRMLIEAQRTGVLTEVIALVAGLTVQDARERPEAERAHADQLHARFQDPQGDLMTLMNLWRYLNEQRDALSSSAFRRQCKSEFLNYLRIREWMDLVRQLKRSVRDLEPRKNRHTQPRPSESATAGEHTNSSAAGDAIHRAVLAGLLSHLGVRDEKQREERKHQSKVSRGRRRSSQEYLGSRGTRFTLHPGSVLAKNPPETVMSVELVETSRLFGRMNAAINPKWAEDLAGDLAKRQYSEPRWEQKQEAAVAYERVTLFGVPIVDRRRVQLKRFDLPLARQLFIRHALVQGEWKSSHTFDRHNTQLRRELTQLEERTRRRGLVGDDDEVFEFYDQRIPEDVATSRDFDAWWNKAHQSTPKLLHLRREDLMTDIGSEAVESAENDREFPKYWHSEDQKLQLRYRFEPGADDDGVTVAVPLPLLPRLHATAFEQLVPGMRLELVTALIKTLPKPIRKHVVPATDWARTLLEAIAPQLENSNSETSLTDLLAAEIRRRVSVPATANDFDVERLPTHLRPTFKVVDTQGRTVGTGKNLDELKSRHQEKASQGVASVAERSVPQHKLQQKHLTEWPRDVIPRHVDATFAKGRAGAGTVRAYPALVDRKTSVDLVLVSQQKEQFSQHCRGVRRLVALSSPSPESYVQEHLSNEEKLLLAAGPYRTLADAVNDICLSVADRVILRHCPDGYVWTRDEFERITADYESQLLNEIYAVVELVVSVLREARAARRAIGEAKSLSVLSQVTDAATQLENLVWAKGSGDGFVSRTSPQQLSRLPVYLKALTLRMHNLVAQPGRDRALQNDIDQIQAEYRSAGGELPSNPNASDALETARWQIEELRVSMFAQQLGTQGKTSVQRIRKTLAEANS